ncbi:MAG: TRAP transporter substrate-binding protein DctP [Pseudolabrys sp.]|nr:TRAP transporter substrate-binding protein DctP [Pseudolabrys sp.]
MKRNWITFAAASAIVALTGLSAPSLAAEVTVRASIQSPAKALLSVGFDWLLDEIEKGTQGRVKFEKYYSGSIAKPAEQLRATTTGLAGLALVVPSYVPAQLPLANVGSNPALWRDSWTGSKAYAQLYADQPAMKAELAKQGVELISAYATPTYYLMARKADLNNVKQLEGMRIMSSGQIAVMLKSMGAQVVSVATPEGYEALQRGTVDGAVYGITAAKTYGIEGVVQSVWELPVGGLPLLIVMNKRVWDSISKEDQAAIKKAAEGHADAFHKIYQVGGDEESLKAFEKAGVKIIDPDAASLAALRKSAQAIWDDWAKEQTAAGRPGKAIMDSFVRLTDDYAKKNPYAKK